MVFRVFFYFNDVKKKQLESLWVYIGRWAECLDPEILQVAGGLFYQVLILPNLLGIRSQVS